MAASSLWAQIDPSANFRVAPEGFAEASEDPSRQSVPAHVPLWSPRHPQFGFGVVLVATVGLIFYVFEHGAGGGVKAHVGAAKADAELGVEGSKK